MPARHRLPDPPPRFIGRSDEVEWLAAAVARAPVAAVWGPGGIGKTALAVHTVRAALTDRASDALRISLRGRDPGRDVYLEILQALAQAQQLTRIDWAGLAGDVDGLTAAVIDLAEAQPYLILLDDVHHADRAQVRDLLLQLARYARDSRWIAVGRDELVVAELPGQVLRLGPMRESELRAVAASLAPDLDDDEVRVAVERAGGSPWTLQQVLGAAPSGDGGFVQGLLGDLPAPAVELLTVLSMLDSPLPAALLDGAVEVPPDDDLEQLVRRGLVERSEVGLQVHDVVRDELRGRAEADAARVAKVARALSASGETTAVLEAVRMLADTSAVDTLGDLLDRHGERLLAEGEAPRLWPHLEATGTARLRRWKLRCALVVGDVRVLRSATEPEGGALEDRLVWARVLWARRQLPDALDEARAVAAEAADAAVRHEATVLAARSLVLLGRPRDAMEALAGHEPPDGEAELRTRVLETHCLRLLGELGEATDRVHRLIDPVLAMVGPAREETTFTLAHAAFELGLLPESRRLVEKLGGEDWSPALYEGRQALMLHAGIAILEGELPSAATALDRLEPYVQRASHLRARLRLARCMLRGLAGELDGYEELIAAAIQDARQVGHPDALALAAALASQWAAMNSLPTPVPEQLLADDKLAAARPDLARYAVLARAHRDARTGEGAGGSPVDPSSEDVHAGLGGLRLIVDAQRALVTGDPARAVEAAREAVRVCQETRHVARELEAHNAVCEMLLGAGDLDGLGAAAGALAELGAECGSARMGDEARFFVLAAAGDLGPSRLEPLAARERVAPAAARRCQALLGGQPRLDAVDERLLEVVRAQPSYAPITTVQQLPDPPAPWEPGWGLDERDGSLWLEDGTTIDLSHRRLLFRLLVAIADHGGEADKERLVLDVWEEPEYHPLHHDNRLHSAVRKLRRLIEGDPAAPRRLLTTEDGYALGAPTRRVGG